MRHTRWTGRLGRGLIAFTAAAATGVAAMSFAATPAAAAPAGPAAAKAELGEACTAADLGKRHPFIQSVEVAPTITHFKGWYVTDGSLGSQTVETSTQTVISVSVGQKTSIESSFEVEALSKAGASVGLDVQMSYTSTGSTSKSITWNFQKPGYYALYEGTKKVTGEYGSLNCNRVDLGDGTFGLKWVAGPSNGSYTTYTTLEEGAVRCEDAVPANSIMRKAQDLLDCGTAAARAGHAPAVKASAPAAAAKAARGGKAAEPNPAGRSAGAEVAPGFTCDAGYYKIGTADRSLFWTAPGFLQGDNVQLKPSTVLSLNLDQWQLCHGPEVNGVAEQILVNHSSNKCLAIAEQTAGDEGSPLVQADCKSDDLQRFYIYRDVPGSDNVGVQNKYTGYMIGHDRYAEGQPLRQYSSGRQDGSGTYVLVKA
ncbi:RICIN domain-containing protein [Streptomyces sp. NBC_00342]|uniref:RICIN domain-containing protein n=1 Tax=Streptomyces sp. NBC_00342 TaxID=2975718 RepID=UPI002E29E338|nr:RICIN domain-containing protein [Streptomyces sp. NBC_00342]